MHPKIDVGIRSNKYRRNGHLLRITPDHFGGHFQQKIEKRHPKRYAVIDAEKALKINAKRLPKWCQNGGEYHWFLKFSFKKYEKYEIKLLLWREHDFTGSGHLKMHGKSIQEADKIAAGKRHAKNMENYAKMNPKWEPKSIKIEKWIPGAEE